MVKVRSIGHSFVEPLHDDSHENVTIEIGYDEENEPCRVDRRNRHVLVIALCVIVKFDNALNEKDESECEVAFE